MKISSITFRQHHEEVQSETIQKGQIIQKGKKRLQRGDAFIKTGVGDNKGESKIK